MPTPDEMHRPRSRRSARSSARPQCSKSQSRNGKKYQVLQSTNGRPRRPPSSSTTVTGTTLWEGSALGGRGLGGSGDPIAMLIAAAIDQVIDTSTDRCHDVRTRGELRDDLQPSERFAARPSQPE